MSSRVEYADRPPYNVIGVLQLTFTNGDIACGTGALIDSNIVLTCSHNLTDQGKGEVPKVSEVQFFPAWNRTPFPSEKTLGGYEALCAFASARYKNGEKDWDVGLVKLSDHIWGDFYMIPRISKGQELVGKILTITGYPENKDGEMWRDDDEVARIDIALNTLLFVVDTLNGSSGSPIYQYDSVNDKIYQYAIHVARTTDAHGLKRSILITSAIAEWCVEASNTPCNNTFLRYL